MATDIRKVDPADDYTFNASDEKESNGGVQVVTDGDTPFWDAPNVEVQRWSGPLDTVKKLFLEGHTFPDALLTVAAAQIGQIMLTLPNAVSKVGFVSGIVVGVAAALLALWTMYLLSVLYLERKADMLKKGEWFGKDGTRKVVTQYHDVIGWHLGPIVRVLAQVTIALQLTGTALAQVIACAGDMYAIDKSRTKREWALIWGAVLMVFTFVPTFRHFRLLNIMALVGTTYTALYIFVHAVSQGIAPVGAVQHVSTAQNWFLGASVIISAMGGHSIALEMMDSMQESRKYIGAYFFGWIWTALLVLPHSLAVNLAFPIAIKSQDNVYGILPKSGWLEASVWLMIMHQFVAYALYATPLIYMWEKIIGTHTAHWAVRLPSRLPVSLVIYFLGVAFPFYGSINSLMSAISTPLTAFALPCLAFILYYRTAERRGASLLPPPKFLRGRKWTAIFVFNAVVFLVFVGFAGTAIFYALQKIVQQSKAFGIFAECYQCPKNWKKLAGKA